MLIHGKLMEDGLMTEIMNSTTDTATATESASKADLNAIYVSDKAKLKVKHLM